MKPKLGSVLLFGSLVALIIFGATFLLNGKQTCTEDVSNTTKEKSAQLVKAPVPIWEKVIKLLVRL